MLQQSSGGAGGQAGRVTGQAGGVQQAVRDAQRGFLHHGGR